MIALRTTLIILAAVLLVGGCSLPGSVNPSVKIGLIAPFEGLYRPVGYDALYAVKLAIREANARRGAEDYLLELVALDDSNLPQQAALAARKLSLDPDMVAVIGHFSDATTRAALPVYQDSGLPLIVTASQVAVPEGGLIFRLYPDDGEIAETIAGHICNRPGKIGFLGEEGKALLTALRERCGPDRVEALSYDELPALNDYTALVWPGGAVEGAKVLAKAVASGFRGEFVGGPELCSPIFAALAGEEASLASCVTVSPASLPAHFANSYQKLAGGAPGPYAPSAYEAAKLVIAAVEDAASRGQVTRETIKPSLRKVVVGRKGFFSLVVSPLP